MMPQGWKNMGRLGPPPVAGSRPPRKENYDRKADARRLPQPSTTTCARQVRRPDGGEEDAQAYAREWLDDATAGIGTVDAYKGIVRNHIEPHLGHLEVRASTGLRSCRVG